MKFDMIASVIFIVCWVKNADGQDILRLETTGTNLCSPQQINKDPSATLQGPDNTVNVDNTSLAIFGSRTNIQFEPNSRVDLKVQSGFRILSKGELYAKQESRLTAIESSHVTVTRKLSLEANARCNLEASRILVSGSLEFGENSVAELYDLSTIRVFEGGLITLGPNVRLEMYRGASLTSSEWTIHTEPQDAFLSTTSFGRDNSIKLFDRSNLHIPQDGKFSTGTDAIIELYPLANIIVSGTLNITDNSRLVLKSQSFLNIGSSAPANAAKSFRSTRQNRGSSSLIFDTRSLTLTLEDRTMLVVAPNTHCLVTSTAQIMTDVTLTSSTSNQPSFRCFDSYDTLVAASQQT